MRRPLLLALALTALAGCAQPSTSDELQWRYNEHAALVQAQGAAGAPLTPEQALLQWQLERQRQRAVRLTPPPLDYGDDLLLLPVPVPNYLNPAPAPALAPPPPPPVILQQVPTGPRLSFPHAPYYPPVIPGQR